MNVRLEPITVENWKDCIALEIAPDQQHFVPSNLYSIAETQFYPEAKSRAIYNEDNQLVGYALFGREAQTQKWKIFRMMIDKAHQHKGYGRAAMQKIMKLISQEPEGNEILISYQEDNYVARNLYAKLGFIEQTTDHHGKVTALLDLSKNNCSPSRSLRSSR